MKEYAAKVKEFVLDHKKQFQTGGIVAVVIIVLGGIIGILIYNSQPHFNVVYDPANACTLFNKDEAATLLGSETIALGTELPVVSGDTAVSKCSYTDKNPDQSAMLVAAVAIRSGVNDKGVAQNRSDFITGKPSYATSVGGIGEQAYFNPDLGQLNVLKGRDWYILSFGVGESASQNTLENDMKLAKLVVQ